MIAKLAGFEALPDVLDATFQATLQYSATGGVLTMSATGGLNDPFGFGGSIDPGNYGFSDTASVTVGVPFSLYLSANQRTSVGAPGSATAHYTFYFGGSPVIVVPEGYVANSADGQIVDNLYMGPVPEPGGLTIALLGLLAPCGCRWRRRA